VIQIRTQTHVKGKVREGDVMSTHGLIRKDHLILIAVISALVITSSSISAYSYFDITKAVYGQPAPDQTNSNTTNLVNTEDIPLEKVRVGDIDVGYKVFGKGEPIILFNGASDNKMPPGILLF